MESIYQCNKLFREKTLHPLASVIDISAPSETTRVRPDSYCIMVMDGPAKAEGRELYGLRGCDFTDGTVLFNLPTKVVDMRHGNNSTTGRMILFHPSLLVGTTLGRHISAYSFFKYRACEALHVSAAEMREIGRVADDIGHELKRGIDDYSATIISNNLELLLNYCLRFYNRQFIMRRDADPGELRHFTSLVDDYLTSGRVRRGGMPCGACRFTQQMDMSAAYLGDMVRKATGKSVTDYAQLRRVELAKQMMVANQSSDARIALTLGYAGVDEFRRIFEKLTGVTTDDYRR